MADDQLMIIPVRPNKSKTYLLPYINEYIAIRFLDRLENTYISFNDEYKICLRYLYSGKKEFTEYEKELESNIYYEKTIDINKKEVLYIFNIPEELFSTLDLFVSGKYSYLPNKELLISFLVKNFGLTLNSKIIKIINRDEQLKQEIEEELNIKIPDGQDISSIPELDQENYYYTHHMN